MISAFVQLLLLPGVTALTVAAVSTNIEATPLVVTLQDYYQPNSYTYINFLPVVGSIPNVDLYAGSEVHILDDAPAHPDLRILSTVVEFAYRIVADKRKGILQPSDLKGKRIGVVGNVTSEYFAYRYLREGLGLNSSEYTFVKDGGLCYAMPCDRGTYPYMLASGQVDALTVFEPTTTVGGIAIGDENAIYFRNDTLYRKLNLLYTTKDRLENKTSRAEIVGFLRALGKTNEVFTKEPEKVWPRVANITATGSTVNVASEEVMRRFWPQTKWARGLPADMADLMAEEDKWVAMREARGRVPMSREKILGLVDYGPLKEALALDG